MCLILTSGALLMSSTVLGLFKNAIPKVHSENILLEKVHKVPLFSDNSIFDTGKVM